MRARKPSQGEKMQSLEPFCLKEEIRSKAERMLYSMAYGGRDGETADRRDE
jgi:hypothetical protein